MTAPLQVPAQRPPEHEMCRTRLDGQKLTPVGPMHRGVIALSRLPGLRHVSVVGCTGVGALAGPDFPENPCLKVFTRVQLGDDD